MPRGERTGAAAPPAAGGRVTRSMARAAQAPPRQQLEPVQPCGVQRLLAGREDEAALAGHLDAIAAYGRHYEQRIEQARALGESVHTIGSHKAKVTEAKGEYEATVRMLQAHGVADGDFRMLWGFEAGIGIDQLWYSPSTDTYIVVEAKGPGAKLSTGSKKGDQMSKEWVANSLIEVKNSKKADAADRRHISAMHKGMREGPPPQVLGKVIEAKPEGGAFEQACPDGGVYHRTA